MFSELSQRDWMFLHAFVQYLSSTAMAGVYEPIQSYGTQIFKCEFEMNLLYNASVCK